LPEKETPAKALPRARTAPPVQGMPANGAELQRRLSDYDARLAAQGLCPAGALVQHVVQAGVKAGHGPDLASWSGPAIALAVEETRTFEAQVRQNRPDRKEVA
jgi:hypothetical protein